MIAFDGIGRVNQLSDVSVIFKISGQFQPVPFSGANHHKIFFLSFLFQLGQFI
jgi:hypothetical protein